MKGGQKKMLSLLFSRERGKKQIIDDKGKAEMLNGCVPLAFTAKVLKAVIVNEKKEVTRQI